MAKELWEMTPEEFKSALQERRRALIKDWNDAGAQGFPPSLGIDTVSERIRLAESAGYSLPEDAAIIMRMNIHQLIVAAHREARQ